MFDHKHYVPILKGKAAEFEALQNLRSHGGITPLIEAVGDKPDLVAKKMGSWGLATPYLVDGFYLDTDESDESDWVSHQMTRIFAEIASSGSAGVPVTGTGRSPAYQRAVKEIVSRDGRGCALRLTTQDFLDESMNELIGGLVGYLGIPKSKIHLVIDSGSVAAFASALHLSSFYGSLILQIPDIKEWRTLSLVGSSFPEGIAQLESNSWNVLSRLEWISWERLMASEGLRKPAYGDYAISHPSLPVSGPATILAQIRYSTPTTYSVFKGGNAKTLGYEQFFSICQDLIRRPEYRGSDFSYGDSLIFEKATTGGLPGNAQKWRMIGTSYHLETVRDQIANHPWL